MIVTNPGDCHEYENAYARQSFVDLYTVVYQEYEQDYEDRIVTVPLVGHDSEGGGESVSSSSLSSLMSSLLPS